jgi:UDP-N-acetylglucosamine kinase
MADEVSKYALESAYKRVERDALERTQQQERPRAILLGGQPGSGKSELANQSLRELRQSGGAVMIDADRMREENPRYQQLSKEDPQNAADRIQKEAAEWSTRLTVTAIEQRRNVVVDGTMRSPENVRELATRLKENGYDVEARVMAVDPETSMARARLRFEEQVSVRGNGRFVNQEQHDNAYAGIPRSVDTLEREKLVDRIQVYDSNQRQVYENVQDRGEWKKAPEAAQTIEQERARTWTYAQHRDYVSVLEDIASLAKQRTHESDRGIETQLESARSKLSRVELTPVHQRAEAFDKLPMSEALAKHPELDGAYAQMREVRQQLRPEMSQDERERFYFNARAQISEELHRGEIPRGALSRSESEKVIDLAAAERGIKSVRDASELQRDVKGEVVAASSQHALVTLSEDVAVRFEKANLDRDVKAGDRVAIRYGKEQSQVYEQGREPAREATRDLGREMER